MKAPGSVGSVEARLGLQHDADSADRGQSAVSPGDGQLYVGVIYPGMMAVKTFGSKTGCVQQVILNSLLASSASANACIGR